MWPLWSSLAPTAPETRTGTPSTASSSSSSSPPSVSFVSPQWRLLSLISQRASHQLAKYPAQYIYASTAAGAVFTVTGTLLVCYLLLRGGRGEGRGKSVGRSSGPSVLSHGASTSGGGCAAGKSVAVDGARTDLTPRETTDGDADIEFADPAESAFSSYLNRIRRQKEAPLLAALTHLEIAAAELAGVRQGSGHRIRSVRGDGREVHDPVSSREDATPHIDGGDPHDNDDDDAVAEAQAKVHRLAVVADELLTQWICSLDGVPVRQSEALKRRRKVLVQDAAALARRISPHLPHMSK
ncbi:hypothetical protein JKF63_05068 [Porcisia hertigi]|uniref:BAG domain-containing protein n=1 Tax=Porcisia hertigi TaxID=2761500 RepID=A0A836LCV2_9TRYP|nr:hypothetical protein JKF63_05068 [Porcisia hertigi]